MVCLQLEVLHIPKFNSTLNNLYFLINLTFIKKKKSNEIGINENSKSEKT